MVLPKFYITVRYTLHIFQHKDFCLVLKILTAKSSFVNIKNFLNFSLEQDELLKHQNFFQNKVFETKPLICVKLYCNFISNALTWVHDTFEEVVLPLVFDGDEVHAPLAAVVPGVEPVPVGVLQPVVVAQPRHPVQVVSEPDISLSVHSCKRKKRLEQIIVYV